MERREFIHDDKAVTDVNTAATAGFCILLERRKFLDVINNNHGGPTAHSLQHSPGRTNGESEADGRRVSRVIAGD